jgi:phage gp46-like protein
MNIYTFLCARRNKLLERMVRESLQWLVNDGLALAVDCKAERNGKSRIDYLVTVSRPYGSPVLIQEVWNVL